MRKISNISLSLILILSTMGLSISSHYCMGKLKDSWLGHEHKEVCEAMEGLPEMEGCCSNETETYIMEDEFSISLYDIKLIPDLNFLHTTYGNVLISEITDQVLNSVNPKNTGPPFTEPDIYVQVQSFLL